MTIPSNKSDFKQPFDVLSTNISAPSRDIASLSPKKGSLSQARKLYIIFAEDVPTISKIGSMVLKQVGKSFEDIDFDISSHTTGPKALERYQLIRVSDPQAKILLITDNQMPDPDVEKELQGENHGEELAKGIRDFESEHSKENQNSKTEGNTVIVLQSSDTIENLDTRLFNDKLPGKISMKSVDTIKSYVDKYFAFGSQKSAS